MCSRYSSQAALKYPQSALICNDLESDFGPKQMEGLAFREYYYNEIIGAAEVSKNYSSYLACFCNSEAKNKVGWS
jgi:hypothetical protein